MTIIRKKDDPNKRFLSCPKMYWMSNLLIKSKAVSDVADGKILKISTTIYRPLVTCLKMLIVSIDFIKFFYQKSNVLKLYSCESFRTESLASRMQNPIDCSETVYELGCEVCVNLSKVRKTFFNPEAIFRKSCWMLQRLSAISLSLASCWNWLQSHRRVVLPTSNRNIDPLAKL